MFGLDPSLFALAVAITVFGGFVKGAVGFAMPMIMISGMSAFLPPDVALAGLIVPTVLANGWQALRGGFAAALVSAKAFWVYLLIVMVFIALSAQLVQVLPGWILYLLLGVPVTLFALAQLMGWRFQIAPQHRRRAEWIIGSFAGFVGGMSGVWGPPTVVFLTAINTPKADQMRVQGVIYFAGALVLLAAHLQSGVLNAATAPLSFALVVPSMIGMTLGFWMGDRLDQARFRRATLAVLVIAGLNLIRRGLLA